MTLLQIDFPSHGPWGEDFTKMAGDLAHHLTKTPGMLWKIWTENSRTGDCGGVYLFTDEASAKTSWRNTCRALIPLGSKMCALRFWTSTKACRSSRERPSHRAWRKRHRAPETTKR